MLIKFETKTAKVKGLAFHPKRRWILASLHNGMIQLWDYDEKTMIDQYDEHKGPVRGIDFHKQQQLFVSGGDDCMIKVWNYKSRRCMFTLKAHDDYIRTTYFHHENPWILSASDDQTVRIWNWQSRTKVATLTGHTNYVMCAQFHPKLELIVSASMDQTLRVWDISGLKKKKKSSDIMQSEIATGMPEIFSKPEYDVKPIEAHNSGANWCCFHPNPDRQYMLSASDDDHIKLWRMDPYREIGSFHGHYNSVNCVIFHPRKNLIISASEDRSIRVWDMDQRSALNTYRTEKEHFWILAAHSRENLFAAGHDTGLMLFKLERERPPSIVVGDKCMFIFNNQLFEYKMETSGKESEPKLAFTLKTKPEITHTNHRLDYKDGYFLVTVRSANIEKSVYDIYKLNDNDSYSPDSIRSQGLTAIFIGRGKIAVLDKNKKVIFKNTSNQERKLKVSITADEIFGAEPGRFYVRSGDELSLWDLEKAASIKSVKINFKFIVVSDNKKFIACVASNKFTIFDQDLNVINIVKEQRKIKSVAWEESGVLIYTTPTHIKCTFAHGSTDTIMSVDSTLYIVAIRSNYLFCLDRYGQGRRITLNAMEYKFRQAVMGGDRSVILDTIRQMKQLKPSEIAFLAKKNYPDLAMHFVKNPRVRFQLALQGFRLVEALRSAEMLKDDKCWQMLAYTAMLQLDVKVAEHAYIKLKQPYKLAMLYILTGQKDKLVEAREMAHEIDDKSSEFLIAILMKDSKACSQLLHDSKYEKLARICLNKMVTDTQGPLLDRNELSNWPLLLREEDDLDLVIEHEVTTPAPEETIEEDESEFKDVDELEDVAEPEEVETKVEEPEVSDVEPLEDFDDNLDW